MLTYPGAKLRLLGAQTQPRMRAHDIICWHTMVGFLTSTDGYFRSGNGAGFDGTESHFGNGGKWGPDLGGKMDGQLFQWQDLMYTADANLDGNGVVLSIENADNAPARPEDIAPFTDAQIESSIALGSWLCTPEAHSNCPTNWACHQVGIPAYEIPDTKPGRRGLGWHAMGVQGVGLVPGGVKWSRSVGKVCPGRARIVQLQTIVFPGIRARLAGVPMEEISVSAEANILKAISASEDRLTDAIPRGALLPLTGAPNSVYQDASGFGGYAARISALESQSRSNGAGISELKAQLSRIETLLQNLGTPPAASAR